MADLQPDGGLPPAVVWSETSMADAPMLHADATAFPFPLCPLSRERERSTGRQCTSLLNEVESSMMGIVAAGAVAQPRSIGRHPTLRAAVVEAEAG